MIQFDDTYCSNGLKSTSRNFGHEHIVKVQPFNFASKEIGPCRVDNSYQQKCKHLNDCMRFSFTPKNTGIYYIHEINYE